MKTTSTKIDAAIAGRVQVPAYLVEIDFTTAIRACTRGTVQWGGSTWVPIGLRVGEINTGQGGVRTVTLSIANRAFTFSTIVLAETASGKRVRVWRLFGEEPYADADAVMVFDGVVDDVPDMVSRVVFNCSTSNARTLSIPNVTVGPPYFNYLPRAGQVIYWGGEQYELQPR